MKSFPKWLTRRPDGVFVIDPDIAYPTILDALKVKESAADQYWLEVAYQCAKRAVQDLVEGTELDPRPARALTIHIMSGARKERWALAHHKPGRGAHAATKGREGAAHYLRVRNLLAAG